MRASAPHLAPWGGEPLLSGNYIRHRLLPCRDSQAPIELKPRATAGTGRSCSLRNLAPAPGRATMPRGTRFFPVCRRTTGTGHRRATARVRLVRRIASMRPGADRRDRAYGRQQYGSRLPTRFDEARHGCRDRTRSTVQYGTKTMEMPSIAEPLRGARNGAR